MGVQIGMWAQTIGQGWLVVNDLGGSATNLAVVLLLRGAPLVLLSPVGGHLAGRYERRRQLMIYTTASAILAAVLAILVATGHIELWMVYITATVAGVFEALASPIRNLLVFDTVGPDEMTNAVALNALAGNAMRVIGPSIGGTLIGLIGTEGTFEAAGGLPGRIGADNGAPFTVPPGPDGAPGRDVEQRRGRARVRIARTGASCSS